MKKRYSYVTECRWLNWGEPCPEGWRECPPIAHHATYGRLIERRVRVLEVAP